MQPRPQARRKPRAHLAHRAAWLLPLVLLATACTPRARPAPPPAAIETATAGQGAAAAQRNPRAKPLPPDAAYPELFAAVQSAWLFEDQKLFADAVPRRAPAAIEADYLARRAEPGFDLARFVATHFILPQPVEATAVERHDTLRAHIDALWPLLTRRSAQPDAHDSLLPLPQPYVVPGGRFREVYYWDSYFTMLGLVESGERALSRQMLDNFAHLIDAWGHVPNGNRSYYLSRSQPPFFSHMVALEARDDPAVLVRYLPQLRREHAFWMDGAGELAPGQAARRAVRLRDGSLLNRYWDDREVPRPESFMQDRETAAESERPAAEVYRDLRAGAESGWDYSSRWLDDGMRLHTIRTTAIVPVDLNSLLHHLETTISTGCARAGDDACERDYRERAERRAAAMAVHLWHPDGYYTDYDHVRGRPRDALTAAALFPLHAAIASPARARSTAAAMRSHLLQPGGLVTTAVDTGQQWDAPNVWAPLQWIAVDGLHRYGEEALARDIARRFLLNVQTVFDRERKLVEKYDADGALQGGGGGEYPLQDGFGWTNGVVLKLFAQYPDLEQTVPSEVAPTGSRR
ncbi:alpha,alpha-trehalase TreA [Luteimonas sp. SJ-92]|uniref:Putative periplasmic trehalase n=1 Tax=Luteimonas salinisoli TaxID=2752307 RepID=A0A853JF15_9GAMM|nr:alpha,alpha-trehalase TreA [Luteimonas salinisoli]NZA27187.1 alpha,alpha-trehalase TreA [Luteimonas salinisoli]